MRAISQFVGDGTILLQKEASQGGKARNAGCQGASIAQSKGPAREKP
jgi:hypothetical protein